MDVTREQEAQNYRSGGLDYPAPSEIEKQLLALNGQIDQLASDAGDIGMAEGVKAALDLAWWLSEDLMRVHCGVGSCGHRLKWRDLAAPHVPPLGKKRPYCACCKHYMDLYNKGEHMRRSIL